MLLLAVLPHRFGALCRIRHIDFDSLFDFFVVVTFLFSFFGIKFFSLYPRLTSTNKSKHTWLKVQTLSSKSKEELCRGVTSGKEKPNTTGRCTQHAPGIQPEVPGPGPFMTFFFFF